MLQQVMTKPHEIEFRDIPMPEPRKGEALVKIMRIDIYNMEVERFEFLVYGVRITYILNLTVDLQSVVVNDDHKIIKVLMARKHCCLPYLAFCDLTVAEKRIYAIAVV